MTEVCDPWLSIITVTLNDEVGLRRTLQSLVENASVQGVEHLVLDGMSDYDVGDVISEFAWDSRLFRDRDSGLYDAMNSGIRLARGDYLIFLNSGDEIASADVMMSVQAIISNARPDFIWGDSLERQLNGMTRYKASRRLWSFPFGMITHHQAMLFKRSVLVESGICYDLEYTIAADYDFALRAVRAGATSVYLRAPVCVFERGGMSYQKRHEGRYQQYLIRKSIYGSTSFAAIVFMMQWMLRSLRGGFPSIYWALRRLSH